MFQEDFILTAPYLRHPISIKAYAGMSGLLRSLIACDSVVDIHDLAYSGFTLFSVS